LNGSGEAAPGPSPDRIAGRALARAPSNIAFIKYWGARDLERAIPLRPSLSMTLTACVSECAVEPSPAGEDRVLLGDPRAPEGRWERAPEPFAAPVVAQLRRIRERAGGGPPLRVVTRNSFPSGAGLASSASGFAALSLAASRALGLALDAPALSCLARESGSGSAARSALGGYVEWPGGDDPAGPARQLAGPGHWELRDVIALVDERTKDVSSREGHRRAPSSPHFERRLELLPERTRVVRDAIADRSLETLGPLLEEEAIELHLVAMSSRPPIFYWDPGTLSVLAAVRELRETGVPAFFTMDAGPNVHVVCEPEEEERVVRHLRSLEPVRRVLRDRVGAGPELIEDPLA